MQETAHQTLPVQWIGNKTKFWTRPRRIYVFHTLGNRGSISLHTLTVWGENYDLQRHNAVQFGGSIWFNVYGPVHRKYISLYIQKDATSQSLFISGNCTTCFGWYFHSSSGAHTIVSTPSGICHTVTAICRYRGGVGTGLSVLWVAYATHSTLKPVPTLPR